MDNSTVANEHKNNFWSCPDDGSCNNNRSNSNATATISICSGASRATPPAVTGDNVYVAWWSNKTGNDEVLFRASTDKGQTFEDKINLSNTPDAGSERVGIDSDGDSVVVTWWETNETSEFPVMRVSDDNGKTFGPLLKLAANGTLGE